MRRRTLKQIIGTFLAIAVVLVSVLAGSRIEVSAANPTVTLKVDKTEVSPGGTVVVTMGVTEAMTAAAFSAKLTLDTDVFTVAKVASNLEDVYYGDERTGQLLINWLSDANKSFVKGNALVQITLRASKDAMQAEYAIALAEAEFYILDGSRMNDVSVSADATEHKVMISNPKSQAVKDVESAIDAIGTVKLTTECLDKITTAQIAFGKLSASEKQQVENYSVLQTAINTYNRLKEEQASQDNQSKIDAVLKKFREDHARVIALSVEDVQISDQAAVMAAIADYGQQDAYIRKVLKEPEYQHFCDLNNRINSLILEEAAVKAAQEQVVGFRETYADLLKMEPNTIPTDELEIITDIKNASAVAIMTYENGFNTIAKEILKDEYAKIQALYEKCIELEILNAPEEAWITEAREAFKTKYLTLLLLTESEVTQEHISQLQEAMNELKELKPAVKGTLVNEYERLMNLLNAANMLQLSTNAEGEIQEIETVVEKIVEKIVTVETNSEGEKRVQILGLELSSGGWFGLLVFVMLSTTMILYAMPIIVSYILRKKKKEVQANVI